MPMDLEQIERLQVEWKSLQPLRADLEKKLWEKLRLEWNYNSNHIEGNTLTYKETEMYLLRGQTSGVHVEREYVEMKGHDYAIEIVRELASGSADLTEADIRNLNQVILKESFYKDAITPDGRPARKQIVPGRYKVEPKQRGVGKWRYLQVCGSYGCADTDGEVGGGHSSRREEEWSGIFSDTGRGASRVCLDSSF